MKKLETIMVKCSYFVALAVALTACQSDVSENDDFVEARGESVDKSDGRLSTASLKWANGTYGASCTGRSGAWSLRLGGVAAMTNPALSVVRNNTACVLTLTSIEADATYIASPSFALTTSYQGSASSFAVASGPKLFYANAKLSSTAFGGPVTMTLLYSDDPAVGSASPSVTYESVSVTSSPGSVGSPNYTLDLVGGGFGINVDASNVVTVVSGTVNLTDGSTTGSGYVIDAGTLPASPTFADYDTVYTAGSPFTIAASNPTIAGTNVITAGTSIASPVVRTIIIKRVSAGVSAYQALKLTFTGL